jgi:hypothetical protein
MSKLYRHHIIPKHAGGSDDLTNIKMVTLEQHAEEHKLLWEKYGRQEDFIAWRCLSGQISKEDLINEVRSMNGKRQGKINADSGFMKKIQAMHDHKLSGKKAAEVCREKKANAFFNEDIRREICRMGGAAQGKKNAESGHLKRIGLLPRKYHAKHWYTNGEDNLLIKEGKEIPKGYKKGRICQRKKN